MKTLLILSMGFVGTLAALPTTAAPNNTPTSVYDQNPTLGEPNTQQPGYFGPAVYPNWNPGNPGMVDDQDQIFKDNDK
jgi:hypothetical protein